MDNKNRLVPDFREETVQTYTETYTPEGGTEQTATYKIGTANPIISGILDKFAWIKTHVTAVWWNKLAGVTLKDKIEAMDGEIAQLNGNLTDDDIITITPSEGSSHGTPGSYYYKKGSSVHIHLSLQISPDSSHTVFVMPEGYRPYSDIYMVGWGAGVAEQPSMAIVRTDGKININSRGSYYAYMDINYDAYN